MKIALIFTGNPHNQRGKFNHVMERATRLSKRKDLQIDVFLFQKGYGPFFRLFKKIKVTKEPITIVKGIKIKNLWLYETLWDYLLTHRIKLRQITCQNQVKRYVNLFSQYDLLSVNGFLESHFALKVKNKYQIPFVVTWHGSDINYFPKRNNQSKAMIKEFLEEAVYNIFVSKALMKASDRISIKGNKTYNYAGASDLFYQRDSDEKLVLKRKYGINTKYCLGFVGNIIPIKNVLVLPEIFKNVQKKVTDISFLVVGGGSLLPELKEKNKESNISNVFYTGNLPPEQIPEVMNTLDILILPSLNEGMPLVTIEAQKSGVPVVGSKVGGIPEAIGINNSFYLDDYFIENISNRIIEILYNQDSFSPEISEFNWDFSIEKEIGIYSSVFQDNGKSDSF